MVEQRLSLNRKEDRGSSARFNPCLTAFAATLCSDIYRDEVGTN